MDDIEWEHITDTGVVYYQRSRNHKLEHYPDDIGGYTFISGSTGSVHELRSLELIGITVDRIAIYRFPGKDQVIAVVREPPNGGDADFRRLYGYTHFSTDENYDIGEFGTIGTFISKLNENDQWKTYGTETYVREPYQKHL